MRRKLRLLLVVAVLVCVGFAATRTKDRRRTFCAAGHYRGERHSVSFRQRGVRDRVTGGECGPGRARENVQAVPASPLDRGGDERREYVELFARQDGWEPSRVHN